MAWHTKPMCPTSEILHFCVLNIILFHNSLFEIKCKKYNKIIFRGTNDSCSVMIMMVIGKYKLSAKVVQIHIRR